MENIKATSKVAMGRHFCPANLMAWQIRTLPQRLTTCCFEVWRPVGMASGRAFLVTWFIQAIDVWPKVITAWWACFLNPLSSWKRTGMHHPSPKDQAAVFLTSEHSKKSEQQGLCCWEFQQDRKMQLQVLERKSCASNTQAQINWIKPMTREVL